MQYNKVLVLMQHLIMCKKCAGLEDWREVITGFYAMLWSCLLFFWFIQTNTKLLFLIPFPDLAVDSVLHHGDQILHYVLLSRFGSICRRVSVPNNVENLLLVSISTYNWETLFSTDRSHSSIVSESVSSEASKPPQLPLSSPPVHQQ